MGVLINSCLRRAFLFFFFLVVVICAGLMQRPELASFASRGTASGSYRLSETHSVGAASPFSTSWQSTETDKEASLSVPFLHLWLPPRQPPAPPPQQQQPSVELSLSVSRLPVDFTTTDAVMKSNMTAAASTRVVKKRQQQPPRSSPTLSSSAAQVHAPLPSLSQSPLHQQVLRHRRQREPHNGGSGSSSSSGGGNGHGQLSHTEEAVASLPGHAILCEAECGRENNSAYECDAATTDVMDAHVRGSIQHSSDDGAASTVCAGAADAHATVVASVISISAHSASGALDASQSFPSSCFFHVSRTTAPSHVGSDAHMPSSTSAVTRHLPIQPDYHPSLSLSGSTPSTLWQPSLHTSACTPASAFPATVLCTSAHTRLRSDDEETPLADRGQLCSVPNTAEEVHNSLCSSEEEEEAALGNGDAAPPRRPAAPTFLGPPFVTSTTPAKHPAHPTTAAAAALSRPQQVAPAALDGAPHRLRPRRGSTVELLLPCRDTLYVPLLTSTAAAAAAAANTTATVTSDRYKRIDADVPGPRGSGSRGRGATAHPLKTTAGRHGVLLQPAGSAGSCCSNDATSALVVNQPFSPSFGYTPDHTHGRTAFSNARRPITCTESATCMTLAAMADAGVTLRSASRSRSSGSSSSDASTTSDGSAVLPLPSPGEEIDGDEETARHGREKKVRTRAARRISTPHAQTEVLCRRSTNNRRSNVERVNRSQYHSAGSRINCDDVLAMLKHAQSAPTSSRSSNTNSTDRRGSSTFHLPPLNESHLAPTPTTSTATTASASGGPAAEAAPENKNKEAQTTSRLLAPSIAAPVSTLRYRPRSYEEEAELAELRSRLAAFVFPPPSMVKRCAARLSSSPSRSASQSCSTARASSSSTSVVSSPKYARAACGAATPDTHNNNNNSSSSSSTGGSQNGHGDNGQARVTRKTTPFSMEAASVTD